VASLVNDAKKSQNSAINQLVYGDNKNLFRDLSSSVEDLGSILKKVKSGEGSLGGIIYDPTVYEDLKEILGNVKRNKVLRELVRISISNNERGAIEATGKPQGPVPRPKETSP
jgi:phospholipid/cholesterol/gamma-HCH transport system substrate-binding protein